jgi:hypothetical protein
VTQARRDGRDPAEGLDRLLERTLRAREDARRDEACLDAETIAAWIDDSLTPVQRSAAETHAAGCDRCLAVLAAIAQTTPPPTVAVRRRWVSFRWVVPLATAAVAMIAWMVVRNPEPVSPLSRSQTPGSFGDARLEAPPAPPERDASAEGSTPARQDKAVSPPPALSRSADQTQSRREDERLRKQIDALSEKRTAKADAGAQAVANQPVSPPSQPAAAAPTLVAPSGRTEAADAQLKAAARERAQPASVIVSSDPASQWRITGTSVERSTDAGRSWRAQPTGTTVDLLAGSSPSPTVCWIVGQRGTVLLSVDGGTWQQLRSPDSTADLLSVTARSSTEATVTTAAGKTYRTRDAGLTWTLQENPVTPF